MSKEIRSTGLRYAFALGLFAVTLGVASAVSYFSPKNNNLTILVMVALVAAAWYAGRGPGLLLAILIEVTAVTFNPIPPDVPMAKVIFGHVSVFLLLLLLVLLVSSRKRAEHRIREQGELLQVMLNSIGDAVIATDLDGLINFLNPVAETLTGWRQKKAYGKPLEKVFYLINEKTREPLDNPFQKIKREGAITGLADHTLLVSKSGKEIPIDDSGAPIKDRDGKVVGSVIVFHDVTSRRQAELALMKSEERLRQSQKMEAIGTLTGGVAHDFNNLLTAILGNTQLALRKIKSEDPLQAPLIQVEKAGNRAAALTRQLLAFSRRQHLDRKNINVNDTIREILKLLERIIGEDVKVATKFEEKLSTVYADRAQLEQVIMNLSVNARDAMPQGGDLGIETNDIELDEYYCRQYPDFQPGKYVQIKVSDSGSGMDEETQSRIFEPFFTTKGVDQGTGLGLSMVYGIVKQHDGQINVYSELGQGTTFKIFLPAIDLKVEEEIQATQHFPPGGAETILVAEDEEALRNLSKDILETLGYKVIIVENGMRAVETFVENREKINLLLFDVIMPSLGGVEAYERICSLGSAAPVIFMTGYSSEMTYNRIERQNDQFDHATISVLQKPYSFDGLGRAIREALDRGE
jgi:two-component system cell cycle sensor histidine kinase/response regulator CckA